MSEQARQDGTARESATGMAHDDATQGAALQGHGGVLRLHLLAENARGPVDVVVDGTRHQLEAGTPAVVHDLPLPAGEHRLELLGKVLGGHTGRANGLIEVPATGVTDHYYALPVVPGMRGELLDEPDKCPGHEWRIIFAAVAGLVGAVYLVYYMSVALGF